eukprot:Phypoly_transcript_00267.p1 GENE.Phypoly_transcript_00267~~Phypoly_transcript_00267.p1  ORF type:complete len:1771 (+),score=197.13 Phypoly_transcript_00267:290-5314(+)
MAHIVAKVDTENYFKFIVLLISKAQQHPDQLLKNHNSRAALDILSSAFIYAMYMLIGEKKHKVAQNQTINILLAPCLDLRKSLIEQLNLPTSNSSSTSSFNNGDHFIKSTPVGPNDGTGQDGTNIYEELENEQISAHALVRIRNRSSNLQQIPHPVLPHQVLVSPSILFHPSRIHAQLDIATINSFIHEQAAGNLSPSNSDSNIKVFANFAKSSLALTNHQLQLQILTLIETALFFGLFHPGKVLLSTYAGDLRNHSGESATFANVAFYKSLIQLQQDPLLSGIVTEGLGFIVAAYNAALQLKAFGQHEGHERKEHNSWKKKPLVQRVFLNLFFVFTLTTPMTQPSNLNPTPTPNSKRKRDEKKEEAEANLSVSKKRATELDTKAEELTDAGKKQKVFVARISILAGLYNNLVYRQKPTSLGMLTERMRALANLLRAGGKIGGNWQSDEDTWFGSQLNKLLDTTFNLLVASHSTAENLTKEEAGVLDAAYDVFVGLQELMHEFIKPRLPALFKMMAIGSPVPCCDELLGALTDFSADARQLDLLFTSFFEALHDENQFSPIYLAPNAVQKLSIHISCLNAQIPTIWVLFLDEWANKCYHKSAYKVARQARFLFLFATFIRSIQFLTTVGYTMSVLYDVFDRTILVAKQALENFEPDESEESESLLRSIIMFHSAIIVIARRINPFREGKSEEVIRRNEKILTKAFPKLLKLVTKKEYLKQQAYSPRLKLALCELMVSRLHDVAVDPPETCFVDSEKHNVEVLEIRSFVVYILDTRPSPEKRHCTCSDIEKAKETHCGHIKGALSPLETSKYQFIGVDETSYPVAHWELIATNIKWIYGYATALELKSILSVLFSACLCFNQAYCSELSTLTIGTVSSCTMANANFYEIWPIREIATGETLMESISYSTIFDSVKIQSMVKDIELQTLLAKDILNSKGTMKNIDKIFEKALSLTENDFKIVLPNCQEISEKLILQLGFIQLLPLRWVGQDTATRLCYFAVGWEIMATLFLQYYKLPDKANPFLESLLLACRHFLLNISSEYPNFLLHMPTSVAQWIVTMPSFKSMALVKVTNTLLGGCLKACLEVKEDKEVQCAHASSAPSAYLTTITTTTANVGCLLQVLQDKLMKTLPKNPFAAVKQIEATLQLPMEYYKKLSHMRKVIPTKTSHLDQSYSSDSQRQTCVPTFLANYLLYIQNLMAQVIKSYTPSSAQHFIHLTQAAAWIIRILIGCGGADKILSDDYHYDAQNLSTALVSSPSFISVLPSFVKTVCEFILPELSSSNPTCTLVSGAVHLINNFAKMHTGLSDRFFLVLLALSMRLSYRSNDSQFCNQERELFETLSRKIYKTLGRTKTASQRNLLSSHIEVMLQNSLEVNASLFGLQSISLLSLVNTQAIKKKHIPLVAQVTSSAFLTPLLELLKTPFPINNATNKPLLSTPESKLQFQNNNNSNNNAQTNASLKGRSCQIQLIEKTYTASSTTNAADVYSKGLEVSQFVILPSIFVPTHIPLLLELIPSAYQMSPTTLIHSSKLMCKLLDFNCVDLRHFSIYFVTSFRTLLKSLSNYPKWALELDSSTLQRAIINNLLILFKRMRVVFRKALEQDVGAIVLDYIQLCENPHHGAHTNTALTPLQPGIIGLMGLCSNKIIFRIREDAITFGKFTWDQLYETMKATARDKAKY